MESDMDKRKIVRTYSAGVFFGQVVKVDGQTYTLKNARRLWYWDGAASLSQLAVDGTAAPSTCKFPVAVPGVMLHQVIEVLDVTEAAAASIDGVPVWKR
jgi:hypothetical protein